MGRATRRKVVDCLPSATDANDRHAGDVVGNERMHCTRWITQAVLGLENREQRARKSILFGLSYM